MADDVDPVLAALQAMVRAGASDQLLGAAVREWTPKAPSVASAPRTAPVAQVSTPAPDPVPRVAVPKPRVEPLPPKSSAGPEIVNFLDSEGKKSSVSFTAEEWSQMLALHKGDAAAARAAVRAIAPNAPPTERRSKWTKQQLLGAAAGVA